jgi:hypothetical protein
VRLPLFPGRDHKDMVQVCDLEKMMKKNENGG